MATFVVVHGAWSAGWAGKNMRPGLRALDHALFTPTHTGRIAHLVHFDAFVPRDGQSCFDLIGAAGRQRPLDALRAADPEAWRLPPNPLPSDTLARLFDEGAATLPEHAR